MRGGLLTGLFDRFFKTKAKPVNASTEVTGFLREPSATFSTFGDNPYANDIFRGAVDAIARNAAKLKGVHVVQYGGNRKTAADAKLTRLLQVRPNPYMNSYDMIYKLSTHYFLYNNSFALLDRDERGIVAGIYPINCTHVDMLADESGELFCRFLLKGGSRVIFPYIDIIHLRRHFNDDELLGASNQALFPALELAHTQNSGIINGIKSSANIRGILKFTSIMSETKKQEQKENFIKNYLQVSNDGGVVVTDEKTEYTPIESHPVILSADQAEAIQKKIYDYLGVTEKIVNSSYSEDEFAAFYESTIEPLAVQMSLEFTSKIFNGREQSFGNKIVFESGRLQFSSNKTKVNLIKELLPLGILTINQALEILNLPDIEDGDRRLQTLNVVDAEKAIDYQLARAGRKVSSDNEGNQDS